MKNIFHYFYSLLLILGALLICNDISAQDSSITLSVNPQETIGIVPNDYIGLSYETSMLLPDENGNYYFDKKNKSLISVFRTLNVKSIRIGGNSVDVSYVPIPTNKDIDKVFLFAKAVGAKIIYSVRLNNGSAESAKRQAKYIYDNYFDILDYFAIGNESNIYYKNYKKDILSRWKSIYDSMYSVAPKAKFCGLDDNPHPDYYSDFVKQFAFPNGPVKLLTIHNYTGGPAYINPQEKDVNKLIFRDGKEGRKTILSYNMKKKDSISYESNKSLFSIIPFRVSETNNIWYGGLLNASDTYAAALWGIDYMYWWASHNSKGINFHTGDKVGGGKQTVKSRYAVFVRDNKKLDIRPLSYSMKLFSLGYKGKMIPVKLSSTYSYLSAYAIISDNNELYINIINKSYDNSSAEHNIKILLPTNYFIKGNVSYIKMEAKNNDVSQKKDIYLGETMINSDGSWNGKWTNLSLSNNNICVLSTSASSILIKCKLVNND